MQHLLTLMVDSCLDYIFKIDFFTNPLIVTVELLKSVMREPNNFLVIGWECPHRFIT